MAAKPKTKKLPEAHEAQIAMLVAEFETFLRSGPLAVVAKATAEEQKSITFGFGIKLKQRQDGDYALECTGTQPAVKWHGDARRVRSERGQLTFLGATGQVKGMNGAGKPEKGAGTGEKSSTAAAKKDGAPKDSSAPGPLH